MTKPSSTKTGRKDPQDSRPAGLSHARMRAMGTYGLRLVFIDVEDNDPTKHVMDTDIMMLGDINVKDPSFWTQLAMGLSDFIDGEFSQLDDVEIDMELPDQTSYDYYKAGADEMRPEVIEKALAITRVARKALGDALNEKRKK